MTTYEDRAETFLTVADVADLLKLNQQTVRNWIDQGSLPAVRVGRRVRIKRSDLDRILESGYQGGPPPPVSAAGPSAEDFWSGEPVGVAELDPAVTADPTADPFTADPEPVRAAGGQPGATVPDGSGRR